MEEPFVGHSFNQERAGFDYPHGPPSNNPADQDFIQPLKPSTIVLCSAWLQQFPRILPRVDHLQAFSVLTNESVGDLESWFADRMRMPLDIPGVVGNSASIHSAATLPFQGITSLTLSQLDAQNPGSTFVQVLPDTSSLFNSGYSFQHIDSAESDWNETLSASSNAIAMSAITDNPQIFRSIEEQRIIDNAAQRARDLSAHLGENCTPTSDLGTLVRNSNRPWQCTRSCGRNFSTRKEWARHEKLAYPDKGWVCICDRIVTNNLGQTICAYCPGGEAVLSLDDAHFEIYKDAIRRCRSAHYNARGGGFYRYQHFQQHFTSFHPGLDAESFKERSSFEVTNSRFPRYCGFCDTNTAFSTWAHRVSHISDHFVIEKRDMRSWKRFPRSRAPSGSPGDDSPPGSGSSGSNYPPPDGQHDDDDDSPRPQNRSFPSTAGAQRKRRRVESHSNTQSRLSIENWLAEVHDFGAVQLLPDSSNHSPDSATPLLNVTLAQADYVDRIEVDHTPRPGKPAQTNHASPPAEFQSHQITTKSLQLIQTQSALACHAEENNQRSLHILKRKFVHGEGTSGPAEMIVVSGQIRRRPTLEDARRTRHTRQFGACEEHRKKKKRCDRSLAPYVPCATTRTPQLIVKLDGIRLFRDRPNAGHPLATKRREIFDLLDISNPTEDPKAVSLSQGYRFEDTEHILKIKVANFIPQEGDKLRHMWFVDGRKRELEMPPICVWNISAACQALGSYFDAALPNYLQHIIDHSGSINQLVLKKANEYSFQSILVKKALRLLAMTRVIERDWHILNPTEVGGTPVLDEGCPFRGTYPVSPAIDTALDQIIIQKYLRPLRNDILSRIQAQVDMIAKRDWFELFLTTFILTTNTQLLLQHSRSNAERYHSSRRYNDIELAKQYFEGHNILLAYFHVVVRNPTERSSAFKGLCVPKGFLATETSTFSAELQRLITLQESNLRNIRRSNMYEAELHWSHQLFDPQWEPQQLEVASLA